MNEMFNFKRFGTYFIADIKGCYRNYGLSLILLSLSGVIYYIISGLIGTIIGEGWETLISGITTLLIFIASSLAIVISMPHKCYGHITDRRKGASYILLPASTFEKFLSMIINSIVVIPAVFCTIFLGTDAILAALDKEYVFCLTELPSNIDIIMSTLTPLDDFAAGILTFLLGAVYFRRHKIAKTILVMICAGFLFSIIAIPVTMNMTGLGYDSAFIGDFTVNIQRLGWIDMTIDLTIVTTLAVLVYCRLKTIKF